MTSPGPGPRVDAEPPHAHGAASDHSTGARVGRVARLVLLLGGLGVALASGVLACPLRVLAGVPCPGCGMTRAVLALAAGEVASAFRHHPLVVLVVPMLVFVVGRALLVAAGSTRAATWNVRVRPPHAVLLGALLFGVWLARIGGWLGGPSDPPDWRAGLLGRALTQVEVSAPPR